LSLEKAGQKQLWHKEIVFHVIAQEIKHISMRHRPQVSINKKESFLELRVSEEDKM